MLFCASANCSLLCTIRKWCVPRVGVEGDACLALCILSTEKVPVFFSAAMSGRKQHRYQTSKMRKVSEGWMMSPASSLKLQQLVNKSINQMAENESSITVMNSSSFSCCSFWNVRIFCFFTTKEDTNMSPWALGNSVFSIYFDILSPRWFELQQITLMFRGKCPS